MTVEHQQDSPGERQTGLRDWLLLRTGVATLVAVSVLGFLVYTGHLAHLWGALPFLLLLSCPLMHFFMHGGHHRHHQNKQGGDKEGG